jgi:hypothetical protein
MSSRCVVGSGQASNSGVASLCLLHITPLFLGFSWFLLLPGALSFGITTVVRDHGTQAAISRATLQGCMMADYTHLDEEG